MSSEEGSIYKQDTKREDTRKRLLFPKQFPMNILGALSTMSGAVEDNIPHHTPVGK